jgi:hypothetical protein
VREPSGCTSASIAGMRYHTVPSFVPTYVLVSG